MECRQHVQNSAGPTLALSSFTNSQLQHAFNDQVLERACRGGMYRCQLHQSHAVLEADQKTVVSDSTETPGKRPQSATALVCTARRSSFSSLASAESARLAPEARAQAARRSSSGRLGRAGGLARITSAYLLHSLKSAAFAWTKLNVVSWELRRLL